MGAKSLRILVAGFGPFPRMPRNPSAELVRAIARKRRFTTAGIEIVAVILPTSYREAQAQLDTLLQTDPDAVVLFGVAGRSGEMRVETVARNFCLPLHPDSARRVPAARKLVADGESTLRTGSSARRLLAAAHSTGAKVRLSRDAGGYLCNAALYYALNNAARQARHRPTYFVHIPMPRGARTRRDRRAPAPPSMARLIRAGEAMVWRAAQEARGPLVLKRHG